MSAEVKERTERLLAVVMRADRLRDERAVESPPLANTDAAKKLRAEWAKGSAGDPLTMAAKRAGM